MEGSFKPLGTIARVSLVCTDPTKFWRPPCDEPLDLSGLNTLPQPVVLAALQPAQQPVGGAGGGAGQANNPPAPAPAPAVPPPWMNLELIRVTTCGSMRKFLTVYQATCGRSTTRIIAQYYRHNHP